LQTKHNWRKPSALRGDAVCAGCNAALARVEPSKLAQQVAPEGITGRRGNGSGADFLFLLIVWALSVRDGPATATTPNYQAPRHETGPEINAESSEQ
jgi:hypothetical protein